MSRFWQNLQQLSRLASPPQTSATFAVPLMIAPGVAELRLYVDASSRRRDVTGLGLVIRDGGDALIGWHAGTARGMTNNEAEYEALIFGLTTLRPYRPQRLCVFADSQVVVDQMNGASRVHSHKLMAQYRRSRQLAGQFAVLSFEHIPREWNVLADAMAEDAVLRVEARSRNA